MKCGWEDIFKDTPKSISHTCERDDFISEARSDVGGDL